MFKPQYKLNVVNPEKNIVSLQLTGRTWFRYFIAPYLVMLAGVLGLGAYANFLEKRDAKPVTDENGVHYPVQ